ncbi:hypothetical protein [Virgisporangium aurantiacum]|uniref:Uncharacterized protein n=1 Tax=Virgisporangium aurantiacum TaxID=175570 RepID=A0A8J4DZA8_9ACTN|nr:hypothetical protein [Virgisporangium aurantiacum]GIJ55526.1 hypothetical protein Vau01_030420 [Virgisporangium aurantiacum]
MPTFDEDVTIERHDLILDDAAGNETARLDRTGNLSIHGEADGRRTEVLKFRAGTARLTVGAPGVPFEVDVPGPGGGVGWLPGRPGSVHVMGDGEDETILLRGSDATVHAGVEGNGGHVVVRDGAGTDVFHLNSDNATLYVGADGSGGDVVVNDTNGRAAFHLNGQSATLDVGTIGNEGEIVVRHGHGGGSIVLNGDDATVTVGGADRAGRFFLRDVDDNATVWASATDATLTVGAVDKEGDLRVRDLGGRDVFYMNGGSATLTVGGEGNAGDIQVRDDTGADRILLDGSAGDIKLMGADVAEDFDTAAPVAPGAVVVAVGPDRVAPAAAALDRRVVGVASGAGDFQPALRLASRPGGQRVPVAIAGRVYCRADAGHGPIGIGDLLTTSTTEGHAMRADDPVKAIGAIIGKALAPLDTGTGLIPVLLMLG